MSETTEHYDRVRRFMQLAGQVTPDAPAGMDAKTRELRARLLMEEVLETIVDGLGVDIDLSATIDSACIDDFEFYAQESEYNATQLLDGCCDVNVITTGTLIAAGMADAEPQRLVDENNLAKFGPGGYLRDDGKWIKPADHQPPNLATEVSRQHMTLPLSKGETRKKDPMFWHPAIPWDRMPEAFDLTPFLHVLGYETLRMDMEDDAPDELMDEYADGSVEAIAEWEPSMPEGAGWFLGAKCDTEDGPQALWLRPDDDRRQAGGKAW